MHVDMSLSFTYLIIHLKTSVTGIGQIPESDINTRR